MYLLNDVRSLFKKNVVFISDIFTFIWSNLTQIIGLFSVFFYKILAASVCVFLLLVFFLYTDDFAFIIKFINWYIAGDNYIGVNDLSEIYVRHHVIYLLNVLSVFFSDILYYIVHIILQYTYTDLIAENIVLDRRIFLWSGDSIVVSENTFYFFCSFFLKNVVTTITDFGLFGENPLFVFGGLFFLTSTICSLMLMSYLGLYGVFYLNLLTLFIFWLSILFHFSDFFIDNYFFKVNFGKWFVILANTNIFFEFYIDSISYSFMLLTVTIAMFVYLYIFSYFRYDSNVERLILFINAFVISMVILVTSGNFFVLFLGWELIGLTSFLLINFWSTRISTVKSAFKAYVFNKFSDVCILIAVLLCFILVNDVNIYSFNSQIGLYNNYYINILGTDISIIEIISFFFICAAFIKSAQFGGHIWLPDSMEAPVPASALIHSATLVSAGIFLLLRFAPLFELSIYCMWLVPLIGSFTAFFGGICAAYQSDIKRILAYSTISHCGFLMVCCSMNIPSYTVLYLYIHGFFKAAVFLCAGNIIRFARNYQDFRRMGNLWKYLPFEFFASFVCLINLCGLPFTLGFYIKHVILVGLNTDFFLSTFILINVLGGALSGLFYSYRFFYYIFLDVKKAKKTIYMQANRSNLKSWYYSNTSLASMMAITTLIGVSYIISSSVINCSLNKNSIDESLDIHSFYNSMFFEFILPTDSLLWNIGYINWLILIFIIFICISSWRIIYNNYLMLKGASLMVVFLFFFYFFLFLLS